MKAGGQWSVTADSRESIRGQAACWSDDTPCIHPTHTNLPTADVGHRLEHIYSLWACLFDGHTRWECQLVCVYKSDCVWEFCPETRCVCVAVSGVYMNLMCVALCINAGVWKKTVHVHLICITLCVCVKHGTPQGDKHPRWSGVGWNMNVLGVCGIPVKHSPQTGSLHVQRKPYTSHPVLAAGPVLP